MLTVVRSRWIISAVAFIGVVSQALSETPNVYKPDQHIIVRMGTKGDRRCVVVAVKPQQDGTVEYQLKAIDNGEVLTVYDRPSAGMTRPASSIQLTDTKLPAASNDPLLTSTLRQPNSKPNDTAIAKEIPVATPTPTRESPIRRLQDWMPKTDRTQASAPVVVVKRDSQRPQTTDVGRSMVIGDPSPLSAPVVTAMVPETDPVPVNVLRNTPTKFPAHSDPVSLGFVVPVSNSQSTPKARNYEREERIIMLGEKLRNALQPSARELAAESLTEGLGNDSAAVRSLLLNAAANDPSANVRATCVRCLTKIGVKDAAFSALILTGKQDPDVRVRIEIDRAEELMK